MVDVSCFGYGHDAVRLFLVRHGHAGRKVQRRGRDKLRPLDGLGRRQAERLVGLIAPLEPTRIVSSPYRRCTETMGPLAATVGLEVEKTPALAPYSAFVTLSMIRELTSRGSPSGVVLCTHGEVIGTVMTEIAAEDGVELERPPPGLKGSMWLIEMKEGRLVNARYLAPR